MELGRIERTIPVASVRADGGGVTECRRLIDQMFRTVRDLAFGLRPSMLDDLGLQPALEWHVRDFTQRYGVDVDLSVSGDLDALPDRHRTCVYRSIQEALTNCVRHAHAGHIQIMVTGSGNRLEVSVIDDGIGFDPARRRGGLGLRGIDERVKELNGVMTVSSPAGAGTALAIHLPCQSDGRRLRLRVLLADDHGIVRRGLRGLVEEAGLSVVAEAADGLEAITAARGASPRSPDRRHRHAAAERHRSGGSGAEARSAAGVIILSMHADESYIIRALAAGARAYLLKDATDEDLLPALRAVAAGRNYFSAAVTTLLVEDYVRTLQKRGLTDSYHLLTDREKEVLHLLAEGRSNKEVATLLDLGLSTVETHRANLMQKLNLHNTAEIVLYAVRKGLIK